VALGRTRVDDRTRRPVVLDATWRRFQLVWQPRADAPVVDLLVFTRRDDTADVDGVVMADGQALGRAAERTAFTSGSEPRVALAENARAPSLVTGAWALGCGLAGALLGGLAVVALRRRQ
jgi:hypothetical protein